MGSVALSKGALMIRADASARIGIGHVMRCFGLAQAWQLDGGHVVFLSYCESDCVRQRVTDGGMEFIPIGYPHPDPRDLQTTLEIVRIRSDAAIDNSMWLVLDGYHFDPVYQQAVRAAGYRLLVVDDMAQLPAYHADIMLNQNLGAEKLKYNCDSDTTLLLGSRYALLRQEFMAWRGYQREIPDVARKVLITMGGSDTNNITLKVMHAVQKVEADDLEVVVVVGGSNLNLEMLRPEAQRSRFTIRLEHDVTKMSELMAWADLVVSAAGSTCWEIAFMGLPALVLVWADNQRGIAEGLERAGAAINLGWFGHVSEDAIAGVLTDLVNAKERRAQMSECGRRLVDGYGAGRVVQAINGRMTR